MIPKIIHFCWFGRNEYPQIVQDCMISWRKMCPGYKFMVWNEDTFDISQCQYCEEAYKTKKWAFVSDYARVKQLYHYGGIYLDTDVELLKPLDKLLKNKAFLGFEHGNGINTGLIAGCEKEVDIFGELIQIYEKEHFIKDDGSLNLTSCVEYTTLVLKKRGLVLNNEKQCIDNVTIYSTEYFCPQNQYTGKIKITENTFSIHHYNGSWSDETLQYRNTLRSTTLLKYGKLIGYPIFGLKYSIFVLKEEGIFILLKKVKRRIKVTYESFIKYN